MKPQKTILLRVDASEKLGLGHLMRCIALAQGFKKEFVYPLFIIKDAKEVRLIADYGFDFRIITQETTLKEDALRTMEIARQFDTRLVIVDLSHQYNLADRINFRGYFRMLKKQGATVIAFDDYEKVDFAADIHIIPYYDAEAIDYRFPDETKSLLGLDYFIFREEFAEYAMAERVVKKKAQNVLISMGGSDPANVTENVINALGEIKPASLNIIVVLGNAYSRRDAIISRIEKFKKTGGQWSVVENAKNMAELMLWSDVIISGGGLIKHEAALMGSPNLIISQGQIESKRSEEYAQKTNAAIHLGHFKSLKKDIKIAVLDLLNDHEARKSMSKKSRNLLDGKGAQRIIKQVLEMETALV